MLGRKMKRYLKDFITTLIPVLVGCGIAVFASGINSTVGIIVSLVLIILLMIYAIWKVDRTIGSS
jgi:hypothetical protein